MNKKGLSAIITTLLVVLLVLVAVGIVWGVVGKIIREGAESIDLGKLTLKADIIAASIDDVNNNVTVTVERTQGQGELFAIRFIFYDGVDSEVVTRMTNMKELESQSFNLHLSVLSVSNLVTISIVPVFESSSGKELLGNVINVYNLQRANCVRDCTDRVCGSDGCWGTCAPGCNDGWYCDDGACFEGENPCDLTSASWSETSVVEGTVVTLTVEGTDCDGTDLEYEIYENDLWPLSDTLMESNIVTGLSTTWITVWEDDNPLPLVTGDPEYYFSVTVVDNPSESVQTSEDLTVTQIIPECGDGTCDDEETCETCEADCGVCVTVTQCNDGLDNDGDGCTDLADSDCTSASDITESGSDCSACVPAVNPCGSAVCGTVQNGTCGSISCGTCGSGESCSGEGICVFQTGAPLTARIVVNDFQWTDSGGNPIDFDMQFPGASLTRYYVPLPIFFQGWESTNREEIVEYEWDFGDGSPRYYGLNAGHVYESTGVYMVTLTIKDSEGNANSDTIEIEAIPREGVTYYVDSSIGNDDYDGRCQTVQTGNCGSWRTASKVFSEMVTSLYQPGDSILFNRGQTFDLSINVDPGNWPAWGYLVGAYGSGAKPIIQYSGPNGGIIYYEQSRGAAHMSFVDLDLRLDDYNGHKASNFFVAQMGGTRNILFLRVDMLDAYANFFMIGNYLERDTSTGTFVIDCSVRNTFIDPLLSSTQFAMWGSRFVLLDSSFDLSGNHIGYTSIDKGVISRNIFSRPAFGRTALRIHGFGEESADWNPDFTSNNIQISENEFHGWIDPETEGRAHNGGGTRYNYLLVQIGPNGGWNQMIHDVIFERNVITNGEGMMAIGTAENITIRNNVFMTNTSIDQGSSYGIVFMDANKPNKNINIIGNDFIFRNAQYTGNPYEMSGIIKITDNTGTIPGPFDYTNHEDITIKNNIFYINGANSFTRFLMISNIADLVPEVDSDNNLFFVSGGSSDGQFFQIGDAVVGTAQYLSLSNWRSQTGNDMNSVYGNPEFVNLLGSDGMFSGYEFDANLHLGSNSPARNLGYIFPTDSYFDFDRDERYNSDNLVDIGAYEY